MYKKLPAYLDILVALAFIFILFSSCQPVTDANSSPKAIDIVGVREWRPLSSGKFICAADDADGDYLTYTWSAQSGTIEGEGNQVIWNTPGTVGDYMISVHITDGRGGEAKVSKSFKVVENPYGNDSPDMTIYLNFNIPSASVVHESRKVLRNTTSEIQCVVQNIGADELTYKWSSTGGKLVGSGPFEGQANPVGWVSPGVAGVYTVSVSVTDKSGSESRGEVAFEVFCCKVP